MPRLPTLLAVVLIASALVLSPAHAQERGSLTGKVTDKKTGHALPFATVTVIGTQRGGLTDSEGRFLVTDVAPGTYEVRVQSLGYRPESRTGVIVTVGKAVAVDFALS